MNNTPFNKPYLSGKETQYIEDAVRSGKISGDGIYTAKCHKFFEERFGFNKTLLTTSCTDALEMCGILLDIQPGDEVMLPSFTFVSTANAFLLRGANLIFADSMAMNPNMDASRIEELITPRTKAIVVVHYAGIACDMGKIMDLAEKHELYVVEDAAQAIDSYYNGKPLGSIGNLGAFSFHETKNVISGEGGMIALNDKKFQNRAEIIREKGTNRSAFFRGEVDKYGWVDIGSSFLPSDIIAAFLFAQLENLDDIQQKRRKIWDKYDELLQPLREEGRLQLPQIPGYATNNGHMYYIVCNGLEERSALIAHLKKKGIMAVFHYISLHSSHLYRNRYKGMALTEADRYTNSLVRLPLFYDLTMEEVARIAEEIKSFYKQYHRQSSPHVATLNT
ncbi:MAG: dTDP-4-amino-4,6-dideoxygalactose transaminase [Bacteroidia bacterium]